MSTLESSVLSYLLHALWLVPLLYLAAFAAAHLLRGVGAQAQHRVWSTAIILSCLLPLLPAPPTTLWGRVLNWLAHPMGANATAGTVSVVTGPVVAFHPLHLHAGAAGFVLGMYAASLLFFIGRLLRRSLGTVRLRRSATPLRLAGNQAEVWQHICREFGTERTRLASGPMLFGPTALGVLRPMVLLPAQLLGTLHADELAAVFAHECAHVRRNDFVKNLMYEVLSLPIAFHPVLALTRRHLAESREILCDQLAAPGAGGPERYARSLVRLATLLLEGRPAAAVHAIGIFDANDFERRIIMLTHPPNPLRGFRRLATLAAAATLGFATCASALTLRTGVTAQEVTQQDAPPPPGTVRISGGVMSGQVAHREVPIYPQAAKDAKIQGSVILHAIIGTDGAIQSLRVVSGPEELRASAWDAVKQWVYKPYLLNGQPTAVETTITVNYMLSPDKPAANPAL